eukprot:CAMPEP_0197024916 /NCGR_PEP_ID=MMETSP1384-20130603/5378_1 /TAXON_ID=29189 /ORGANISM="Ammonia sp." /LENGTH=678 /DNA_ID=CAMNT_0042453383 /DNA_START=192 /DNA_END=2228 /DNA_ORIENTATION=+
MPQKGKKKGGRRSPNKNSPNRRSPHKNKKSNQPNQSSAAHNANGANPQSNDVENGQNTNNDTTPPNESQAQPSATSTSSSSPSSQEPQTEAMKLKDRGNEQFQNQNYQKAIEFYSKAIELEPNNHTFYSNRSAAYNSSGQYEEALQDADKCIELQPDWAKGYVRKGNVYQQQKKLEQAEECYKLGLKTCAEREALRKALNSLDMQKITGLERPDKIVGGHHAQAEKFRTLFNWLLQGGAKFPKLFLKFYSPEYRAIHAMERIEKDEDLCYIPHDYIMTSDVAKASVIGQKIICSKVDLRSKHSYLAAYLLQEREKGLKSRWHVYIDILPRKFETIPLFFDEAQRAELAGSIALKKIDDRLESLRLEYEAICSAVPDFNRFTLEEFTWARLVVITRIFGLVIDDVKTDGLVPMADMLNHRRPRETKWTYSQKKRGFLITALQTIDENAEIFDSYGRKCNSRFFVNYGFSLEDNADNEALMTFELPRNDPQYTIKARHLGFNVSDNLTIQQREGIVKKDFQIPMQYKEKKVKEAFSFLRVLHAQGNEFLIISSADGLRLEDIPPLSIRNETNVLTSLAVSATRSLKQFTTTLEHDNQLLANEELYPRFTNKRNTVLMRRGEKDVLSFYVELMKVCLPLFKMKFKDLRNKIRKEKRFKDNESPLMQYINYVVLPLVQRQSN